MPRLKHISVKARRYCQLYITGRYTQAEAYRMAGFSPKGNQRTLNISACKALKNPQIRKYMEQLQTEAARAATITAAKVISDIDRIKDKAERKGKLSVALKASELQGKYINIFQEQIIPTVINVTVKEP